jgi:hypothetical protein
MVALAWRLAPWWLLGASSSGDRSGWLTRCLPALYCLRYSAILLCPTHTFKPTNNVAAFQQHTSSLELRDLTPHYVVNQLQKCNQL